MMAWGGLSTQDCKDTLNPPSFVPSLVNTLPETEVPASSTSSWNAAIHSASANSVSGPQIRRRSLKLLLIRRLVRKCTEE